MAKLTDEMTKQLSSTNDYQEFYSSYRENFVDEKLSDYLIRLLEEKQITISQVAKESGYGDYVYKLFSGKKENPSRDVLICMAFGMHLAVEEIGYLMRVTHYHELDSRDKRDAAILFAINKEYDLPRTNDMLFELNLKLLNT